MEKAAAQNTQHALLAEAVAASVLLSRLAVLDAQTGEPNLQFQTNNDEFLLAICWNTRTGKNVDLFVISEAKFANFWNLVLNEKKPLFTTEKFLSQANDESKAKFLCVFPSSALKLFRKCQHVK